MSYALDMLLAEKPVQHRFVAPEGWSLCSVCRSIRSSDYHVELPDGWGPIATAPKNATWIEVIMSDGTTLEAHWAQDLSGEDQPPFQGWFNRKLVQIETPDGWRPISK